MKILELTLQGVDVAQLRQFYIGFLGLRDLDPQQTDRLAVLAGQTRLAFTPVSAGLRPRYHFAFGVPPTRLEAAVRWLGERRGLLASPTGETRFHSDTWNADMVYFTDPQGNILELIASHEAESSTSAPNEQPFNAIEILGVAEIGLTTDSVANTGGALIQRLPGLQPYPDPEAALGGEFGALGDAQGRLIVVQRGRIWFPETGVPADFLPLEALVEVHTGMRYRITAPPFPFAVEPAGS